MWKLALTALACLHTVLAFNCPDDSHSFYHADVSTGCQVYHHCQNSQLQTLTCPSGQAFNHESSQCEDASTVNCYETMGHHAHHHHHKRAIEVHHTIDIRDFKNKIVDAYYSIRPIVKEAIENIAPSIYAKFEESYLPAIRDTKKEVLPFFYEKVYPHVKKWSRYSLGVIGQVIEKAYQSYKLSNSTHITIVSMSDIIDQVSKDLQPVIRLGRYLSSKMHETNQRVRSERSVAEEPVVSEVSDANFGNRFSFINGVLRPKIAEMVANEETKYDILSIALSAKSSFLPVVYEMYRQTSHTPEGTVIRIPKHIYTAAVEKFQTETRPIIRKVIQKHFQGIFKRASADDVSTIEGYLEDLEVAKFPHATELKTAVLNFIAKHGEMLKTSTDSHINLYPFHELLGDFQSVMQVLLKAAVEYSNEKLFLEPKYKLKKEAYVYSKLVPNVHGKKM